MKLSHPRGYRRSHFGWRNIAVTLIWFALSKPSRSPLDSGRRQRERVANAAVGTFVGSVPLSGLVGGFDRETGSGWNGKSYSRIRKDPQTLISGGFSIMSLLL